MRHLPKPLPGVPAEQIYRICVDAFQDARQRQALQACEDLVRRDSAEYEAKIPRKIGEFQPSPLPGSVGAKDLKAVYLRKFARKDEPGRPYYDAILSAAPNGICPLCGVQQVRTLDHYLPKSRFPLLVVTPANLVPTCRDCNFDKLAYAADQPGEAPLHPYFDDLSDEIWLDVEVLADGSVRYRADCPAHWSHVLKSRVEAHLCRSALRELYGSHAAQEIASSLQLWKTIRDRGSAETLLQHLRDVRDSAEQAERNSWKAALYRGLVRQFSVVEAWIAEA